MIMKEKVCGIYKITNDLNGMSYIGQSVNCMQRWANHKNSAANTRPIDKSINEFGKENFTFSILLECPADMLDVWERDMINLFDTYYPKGYNYRGGGRSGFDTCEDTRRKMSILQKGENNSFYNHHHTEDTRRKMSEKRKGEGNPMYGKPCLEEIKRKISETLKNKPKPKWLTPNGEIRIMDKNNVSRWHPDWIKIEE